MRGFREIFRFTLSRQWKNRTYLILTILVAVVFFLVPYCLLPSLEQDCEDVEVTDEEEWGIYGEETYSDPQKVSRICFVSEIEAAPAAELTIPWYEEAEFIPCASIDEACAEAEGSPYSLILYLSESEGMICWRGVLPYSTELTEDDAYLLGEIAGEYSDELLCSLLGVPWETYETALATYDAEQAEEVIVDGEDADTDGSLFLMSILLPYLNVMLAYFMILYYGQGAARNCILEKTSKLMDTFLVSVDPRSLLFGKVFAYALSAFVQAALWVSALALGIGLGLREAEAIHAVPLSTVVLLIRMLVSSGNMFSVGNAVLAVLVLAAGFLLYCSLSSIGGAIAGKPEELGGVNILFTGAVIVSFLVTLESGTMALTEGGSIPAWLDYVPFTAPMITPSRILLGMTDTGAALISISIMLAMSVFLLTASGRIYRMMSFYRGSVPKLKQLFAMASGSKTAGG